MRHGAGQLARPPSTRLALVKGVIRDAWRSGIDQRGASDEGMRRVYKLLSLTAAAAHEGTLRNLLTYLVAGA